MGYYISVIRYEQLRGVFVDPTNTYGVAMPGELLDKLFVAAMQHNENSLIDTNVIEKLERKQTDDMLIVRWAAKLPYYSRSTLEEVYFRRYQAGLIYKPSAQLLVIYSDADAISNREFTHSPDSPPINLFYYPMLLTTTAMWKQLGIKRNYTVALLSKEGAVNLLQLEPLIVQHVLWTDEYELPPLSVDAINKTIVEIKQGLSAERER